MFMPAIEDQVDHATYFARDKDTYADETSEEAAFAQERVMIVGS